MPASPHSSRASATCRPPEAIVAWIEWRPSRLMAAGLALLGMLAAGAVLGSEMPRAAALCLACAASLHGMWLAWRQLARPAQRLRWDGAAGVMAVDGMPAGEVRLHWRGPLLFLCWRDARGAMHRLSFWPDVLDARQRRLLRLVAGRGHPPGGPAAEAGQARGRLVDR